MIEYKLSLLIPQEFMCVPSCILLIMDRKDISIKVLEELDADSTMQYYLASMMDLRVPKDLLAYFEPFKDELKFTISEDKHHNGCNIVDLNKQVFQPLNIPLKEEFHPIRNFMFDNYEIFNVIKKALSEDNDVIVFLDYNVLTHNEISGQCGHALLVNDINIEKKTLTITNPVTEREIVVDTIDIDDRFIKSMESFGSGGGISIIKKLED